MNALQRQWESVLADEGLEPYDKERMKLRHEIPFAVVMPQSTTTVEQSAHWTHLTHVVHALPSDYRADDKAYLLSLCETGYVNKSCRALGITEKAGRCVLIRLRRYLQQLTEAK